MIAATLRCALRAFALKPPAEPPGAPAGATNAPITIVPINNNRIDGERTVTVTLRPGNYIVGGASNATVTIRDDDLPPGTLLFAENFDTDTTASWMVNKAHEEENRATLFYDYSADGIPPAPNTTNGTTRGLKLEANMGPNPTFTGLSVSPIGQNFEGDYRLRFDMWINYNGPLNGGGTGSTFVQTGGVGTSGTVPQWAGGRQDSIWFGATGDGGSSVDFRAYSAAAGTGYTPTSGVFTAGISTSPDARNNIHPYYAEFGRETAPSAQLAIQSEQTGETIAGSVGMTWRDVVITKQGTNATFVIDGRRIASVDLSALTLLNNIFVGYFDINATQSANSAMSFGLVDNLRVEALGGGPVEAPRITSVQKSGGNLVIGFSAPGAAQSQLAVQSTAQLSDTITWQDAAGVTIESIGAGQYRATVPLGSEPARFYRIAVR